MKRVSWFLRMMRIQSGKMEILKKMLNVGGDKGIILVNFIEGVIENKAITDKARIHAIKESLKTYREVV